MIVFGHSGIIDTAVHKIGDFLINFFSWIRSHIQNALNSCIEKSHVRVLKCMPICVAFVRKFTNENKFLLPITNTVIKIIQVVKKTSSSST
jgi:hypothetical protein